MVTSNYIAQAYVVFTYLRESNPDVSYVVLVVGERPEASSQLPEGPQWIYWDELLDQESRWTLARNYTPFELSCVMRGRFHHYFATGTAYEKWIMVDTDIAIIGSLDPLWNALDQGCIALTPHTTKPVEAHFAVPHEANILRCGMFNGGVVGMRRSEEATRACQWLQDRLESYGHSHPHRVAAGMQPHEDFEYVDQIWLNLMATYFWGSVTVVAEEICNLGHWNLHQGSLRIDGGMATFNHQPVVIAHFSGLPTDRLATVSAHSKLYLKDPCSAWESLASEYLHRLENAKMSIVQLPYSYDRLQPSPRLLHRVSQRIRNSASTERNTDAFRQLKPSLETYETFIIRTLILNEVKQKKAYFHGILLDVGAGSAPYEEVIATMGRVTQYIKLDVAAPLYHQPHNSDMVWDGDTIPLGAGSVDTVLLTEVLEHVKRPAELLSELRRVLKPGGTLFLTVPFLWPLHELPNDHHRFTPIALRSYLEEAGFDVQEISFLGGFDHSLAQALGLWLTNRAMGKRTRKVLKILAWPVYAYLARNGWSEKPEIKNHQMFVGLSALAKAA